MNPIIKLDKYRVKEDPTIEIPLVDMLFDGEKRKAIYENYDRKYEENLEEKEVFESMTYRTRRRDK